MMNKMLKKLASLSFVSAMLIFATPVSSVFAADEMTIDDYIDEARPYLHLSCESAWEFTGEDKEEYVAIINKFVAIIFINHNFDVSLLEEAPEADQEQLKVIFYNKIGEQCQETPQELLAGVVESSLVYAFDEMKPKID